MQRLPARPSLDHLKKQAKRLLDRYRNGDAEAIARFRAALPAATGKPDGAVAGLGLRLRDAQSCIAREYGFASWVDLKSFVEARMASLDDHPAQVLGWLRLVYAGDISGSGNRAGPAVAGRMLQESPALLRDDPYLACAVGDEAKLRQAIVRDPGWVNCAGGRLNLPPLVAVAHSSLVRLAGYRDGLHACARLLLEAGANADQSVGNRWAPASLSQPSEKDRLSALYGAAGQNHDPELTELLLKAGANPNDGESLYHSLESPACTQLLLKAGARIAGSNALYRALDLDTPDALRLLLAHGGDPNEPALGPPTSDWGTFLLEHGASWQEQHGFGDNACGTLSWASVNEPVEGGDWLGCAEALVAHGMPAAQPDPASAESVLVGGTRRWFSEEVTDFLLATRPAPADA